MPKTIVGAALFVLSFVAAGCDENSTSGDLQAFCDHAAGLDQLILDRHPTDEELDEFLHSAPEEIREDVETLVASAREFRSGNEDAADSPEIQAAGNRLDEFVEANC